MGKLFAKSTSSVPVLHNGAGNSAQQKNRTRVTARSAYKTVAHLHHKHFCHGWNRRRSYGADPPCSLYSSGYIAAYLETMCKSCGLYCCVFCFLCVQIYVLPHLTGILNFLVLFTTGFFCRILPSVAIAAYAVKTTTVSELISGMERIHMPKEVTIPLTVMFRFFPTVFQESEAISDAMKMRGIKLGGKKSSKILEYKLIPMITCSVKIGEELSAAAITRGLGAPVKRTNICQLKFNFADVVLILFCCFVVFWAIASPIISAGGILP